MIEQVSGMDCKRTAPHDWVAMEEGLGKGLTEPTFTVFVTRCLAFLVSLM